MDDDDLEELPSFADDEGDFVSPEDSGGGDDEAVFDSSIDQILQNLPIGSVSRVIGNNMYGINFRQTGNAVPRAKDHHGYIFLTRPQLNLSSLNITNFRGFYNLLTTNQLSYQRFTRLTLDPRLGYAGALKCPFVNNELAFIPILTNNAVSLSGWPDLSAPSYTTPTGLYGEEVSFVDGVTNHYEAFDVDITFRNTKGNPLIYFFYIWIKYATLVFEGILNPYMDMITENEIDYNTRIYRIVLDQQKRYVTYIASTGASYPENVPTGNIFDFNVDTPYNTKNSEINIRFKCMGFTAFEDIVKLEFNKTSAIFSRDMYALLKHDMESTDDDLVAREDGNTIHRVDGCRLVKLPYYLSLIADSGVYGNTFFTANHRVFPYINLVTNELEYWVPESVFNQEGAGQDA